MSGLLSTVADLKTKLTSAGAGLESLAATGLSAGALSKLSGQISALGTGGAVEVKLPTVATETFDSGPMIAQAKALLGDVKIPGINFGEIVSNIKPLSADQAKEYDTLKAKLSTLEDQQFDLNRAYLDAKAEFGVDGAKTIAAKEAWKVCIQDIDATRTSMSKAAGQV